MIVNQTEQKLAGILGSTRKSVQPWYVTYALLGAVSSGLIPIILPLMMVKMSNQLATVGYVMGAFNLGALSSPAWGNLADKRHLYRTIFSIGFVLELGSLAAFPLVHTLLGWFSLALVMGAGSAAVATCATLFVVEFHPRSQWTARIAWLQTFNGTGQVAGLLLAGACVAIGYRFGLWLGAGLLLVALVIGLVTLPKNAPAGAVAGKPSEPRDHVGFNIDFTSLSRVARVELLGGGLLKHFTALNMEGFRNIRKLLPTRFGRFLLSWLSVFLGVAGFFAYFPIYLKHSFGILPATTSLSYAVAAGAGVALYTLAGRWTTRYGAARIYFFGRVARLLGFALLLTLMLLHARGALDEVALLGFGLVVLSWPVLSVTGTDLTSELSPITQGAAQGLNNAANALGTVAGTYLAGAVMHFTGYVCIPIIAILGLLASLALDTSVKMPTARPDAITAAG